MVFGLGCMIAVKYWQKDGHIGSRGHLMTIMIMITICINHKALNTTRLNTHRNELREGKIAWFMQFTIRDEWTDDTNVFFHQCACVCVRERNSYKYSLGKLTGRCYLSNWCRVEMDWITTETPTQRHPPESPKWRANGIDGNLFFLKCQTAHKCFLETFVSSWAHYWGRMAVLTTTNKPSTFCWNSILKAVLLDSPNAPMFQQKTSKSQICFFWKVSLGCKRCRVVHIVDELVLPQMKRMQRDRTRTVILPSGLQ